MTDMHRTSNRILSICFLLLILVGVSSFGACASKPNLVRNGSFEGGLQAVTNAGWVLGSGATLVETGGASDGKAYLKVDGDTGAPILKWVDVKPNTGYVARCRVTVNGGGHLTFAIHDRNSEFYVCRDVYINGAMGKWSDLVLPFRSGNNTSIGISVGKRYGSAICYDKVELYEDDSVQIGDMSPRPKYRFPSASDAEKSRGYLIAQPSWTDMIYPTYYPTRSQMTKRLSCQLTPGEREPVSLLVSAIRALNDVRVSVADDLKSKDGGIIPAKNIDVRMVKSITRWLNNSAPLKAGQRYERRPLFLFPASPVGINEKESQQYWLTVRASDDTPAGDYSGSVKIMTAESGGYTVPIVVRVLPFKLAESEITYGMYYQPHEQYPEYINAKTFLNDMRDMKEHGMNSTSVYAMVERRDDYVVDFDYQLTAPRYSLNHLMNLMRESGLMSRNHPVLYIPEDYREYMYIGKEKTVQAIKAHEKKQGWPELLFYIGDEPSVANIPNLEKITSMIHGVPGARTVTAGVQPGPLGNLYDVWISSVYEPKLSKVAAEAQKEGKESWIYDCQAGGAIPVNDRYIAGLLPWASGVKGVWQWCYTEPPNGGRVNAAGEIGLEYPYYEGPWSINYVLRAGDTVHPTIGWEVRREGIDDCRYILTLERLIASIKLSGIPNKQSLALEAEAFLKTIARKARRDRMERAISQVDNVFITLYNPTLRASDYDKIRLKVTGYILQLQK